MAWNTVPHTQFSVRAASPQLRGQAIHPSGVLRNLLVLPRPLDFLSNFKTLGSAKGLGECRRACGHNRFDVGLGFLNTYGGLVVSRHALRTHKHPAQLSV